jgi:kynurenine formamidase
MLLELSVPFYPGMPKYDETIPELSFIPETRQENGDPNNTSSIQCFLHMGSHVDAPYHFDYTGSTIDRIPIEKFHFKTPILVNLEGRDEIRRSDLEKIDGIAEADLLLIYTGASRWINDQEKYIQNLVGLDYEAASFIRRELPRLFAVGTDAISIEKDDGSHAFPVHHELLDESKRTERTVLIYENLNLSLAVCKNIKQVYAFPIRLTGMDASPVSMVADIL